MCDYDDGGLLSSFKRVGVSHRVLPQPESGVWFRCVSAPLRRSTPQEPVSDNVWTPPGPDGRVLQ